MSQGDTGGSVEKGNLGNPNSLKFLPKRTSGFCEMIMGMLCTVSSSLGKWIERIKNVKQQTQWV